MAVAAEPRNKKKTKEEEVHESIGQKVADQDLEHQKSDREYKLEFAKASARKVSRVQKDEQPSLAAAPFDQVVQ